MLLPKPPTWIPCLARAHTSSRTQVASPDVRVDALIDAYVEWREECAAVGNAYEGWTGCERADRRLAYSAYHAALDREEKAAAVYQMAATQLVAPGREPHEC